MLLVTTVTIAYAGSKSYYGLTTVTYTNGITDHYLSGWNASYSDSTSPSRSMDQFGLTYWQAYCKCDGVIQYSTMVSYSSGMLQYNKTSVFDGMALSKAYCTGQTKGYNYAQHWWQDAGYSGDGATLSTSKSLTSIQ